MQLLFGNTSGLFAQPVAPKGRIIVIGARGGDDKKPGVEHRGDTIPICNSLIELGWWAQPVFYADTSFELLIHYAEEVRSSHPCIQQMATDRMSCWSARVQEYMHDSQSTAEINAFAGVDSQWHMQVDGYISRVNPDVYEDFTVSKFDRLLGHLHQNMGLAAMAHPSMIQRFGAKDALAKIAPLRTGLPDTAAYYDKDTWRQRFPVSLAQGARCLIPAPSDPSQPRHQSC